MLALDPAKPTAQLRASCLTQVHSCYVRLKPRARARRRKLVHWCRRRGHSRSRRSYRNLVVSTPPASVSELDRAIAVLPFENLSSNPNDQFFVIGIQDEILTKSASLADLKVIARTSTQGYKSKPDRFKNCGPPSLAWAEFWKDLCKDQPIRCG